MLIFRLQIVFKACLVCSNVNHEVIFFSNFSPLCLMFIILIFLSMGGSIIKNLMDHSIPDV